MNMLQVLVVLVTLLAFALRWHYVKAGVKSRSVEAVESTRSCGARRLRLGAGEGTGRQKKPRSAATRRACSAALRPPCKRDPDICLDNEPIGLQPCDHTYTAYT